MLFEWDETKRKINLIKHGLDFIDSYKLWQNTMVVIEDRRYDYGEVRYIGYGGLEGRIVVCAYTLPACNCVRIISLRKANRREIRYYEKIIEKK